MATRKKQTNPTLAATQRKGQRKATRKASKLTTAEKKALGRLPRKALVGIIVGLVAALGGAAAVGVHRMNRRTLSANDNEMGKRQQLMTQQSTLPEGGSGMKNYNEIYKRQQLLLQHGMSLRVGGTLRRWRQGDTKGRGGTRKKGKGKKTTSTGLTTAEKKALGRKSRKALVGIISALVAALGVGGGVMALRRWRLGNGASKNQHYSNGEYGGQAIVPLCESHSKV